MKLYLYLMLLFYCSSIKANCLLKKVSISQRTDASQLIVNGEVKSQYYFYNAEKTGIFTVSTVEIIDFLKGNAPATVEIVTPGGELDGKLVVVEPNANLKIGDKGVFFLIDNTIDLDNISKTKKYEIYSLAQGFITLDETTNTYRDPFDEYKNIITIANLIQKTTQLSYKLSNTIVKNINNKVNAFTFSPTVITAGTGSVLTISGSGFGARTGSATVQFRNVNDTTATNFVNIPDSSYIVSWTNNEIKVIVPGASINGQSGAGSGLVKVVLSNGATMTSTGSINISYNQFEYQKKRIALINKNSLGGYTFTLNSSFDNNIGAKSAFVRALNKWKCTTGVNITLSNATTTNSCVNQLDSINTFSFANSNCVVPSGTLALTFSTFTFCSGSPIFTTGIDMIFNNTSNYFFGTGVPNSNLYDFESVVLHELGHSFGQGHHSNANEVMFISLGNGISKRNLNPSTDIQNVLEVITRSTTVTACNFQKHIPILVSCITPIVASFSSDKTTGCTPLTVHFSDSSSGSPTQWKWDIDNNGITDYTTQNPTHTFTTPSTYNVKMVASNSSTADSIIKTAQIIVAPALSVNVANGQPISCFGGNNGTLVATPSGGNGTYTYLWSNNQTQSIANNLSAANYIVTVKDGFNCISSASKTITQPSEIQLNLKAQAINVNIYNVILDVQGGVVPYTFLLNNNIISVINDTIKNLNVGSYILTVRDSNNCTKNTSFSLSPTTAVIDLNYTNDALVIYPNPTTDNLFINFYLKEYQNVQVELYDLLGQIIYEEKYNVKDKQTSINLSNLSNGTYILKFEFVSGNEFRKIVVNR